MIVDAPDICGIIPAVVRYSRAGRASPVLLAFYLACVALVCSFILFEVLDIDGSDFPVATPGDCVTAFKNINDWGEGVRLPLIPEPLIDDIIYRRPFSLFGW